MKPSLWRIKAKAGRFFSQGGQLIRRAWALFVADGPAVLALGLVLMALPGILKTWLMGDVATMNVEALLSGLMNGRYVGMNSTPGWLLEIATAILFVPAMYGCLSLLFSGRWEGSPRSLVSALQTVRIKLGKVVLSGLQPAGHPAFAGQFDFGPGSDAGGLDPGGGRPNRRADLPDFVSHPDRH